MFFAYWEVNGKVDGGIYFDHTDGKDFCGESKLIWDTFIPSEKSWADVTKIDFHIHGKTYQERKDCLYDLALDYQSAWQEYCFSYSELLYIGNWFEKNARRYGLLEEFRENCIC